MEVTATIRSIKEVDAVSDKSYVVRAAKTRCTFGSEPSRLDLPFCHGIYLKDKPQLNIMDCKPLVNIFTFGRCKKRGACMPSVATPWIQGKEDVLLNGQPALLNTSMIACLEGGIIRITDDGQELE